MDRAGNAGIIASFAIAFFGVAIGAFAAYVSEYGSVVQASKGSGAQVVLRDDPLNDAFYRQRQQIVQRVLASTPTERFAPPLENERLVAPSGEVERSDRPKIIIVFDDMGLDRELFDQVLGLPGPVTFSFLPYAHNAAELAQIARAQGAEIMLHLPMEPRGNEDPGPFALMSNMSGADFLEALEWNLSRLEGYVGVNNHMGSKLTADDAAMRTVLAYLRREGLFFLDSVTTGSSVVRSAGARVGADVIVRDVFLDATPGDKTEIRRQLALVEEIARETGYALAICHPRPETLEVLGPWLASAPQRGFELAPASTALAIQKNRKLQHIMALAPGIRG